MMAKVPENRFAIPLLLVTPLRRFAGVGGGHNGTVYKPGSGNLNSPSSPTLPRPDAPGTEVNLPRPSTQTRLVRPGLNGGTKPSTPA
jgi:hypothetical protein